jgi:UDP-N-acetylmuramoylalanine--D-glutamate ligase
MTFDDYRKFFVFGMARSGRAVATLLRERGREVAVYDDNPAALDGFDTSGIAVANVGDWKSRLENSECLVVSPGVANDHAVPAHAREHGIAVIGEIEAAFHYTGARIVAVTGTNGKSTVVGVIGDILRHGGRDVDVAGNIGHSFSESVREGEREVLVLELSSFQLDTIVDFRADVAVLLNVTPDHLDRYGNSMEAYAASKARVLNGADSNTVYVYNAEDRVAARLAGSHPGRGIGFSSARELTGGVYQRDGVIVRSTGEGEEDILRRGEFTPVGVHNLENALAAVAVATAFDVPVAAMREALRAYRPLPHRMELVRVIDGVAYVNDSKATNVDATIMSLRSVDGGTILILGGRDKDGDFAALIPHLQRVRTAVLIGEAAALIRRAIEGHCPVEDAADMAGAVALAQTRAEAGDTVLLAPACASFDMFDNYQERGNAFREAVKAL